MYKWRSGHKVQWSVESSLSVHVLPILSRLVELYHPCYIALNFLVMCSVERAEAHELHHIFVHSLTGLKVHLL